MAKGPEPFWTPEQFPNIVGRKLLSCNFEMGFTRKFDCRQCWIEEIFDKTSQGVLFVKPSFSFWVFGQNSLRFLTLILCLEWAQVISTLKGTMHWKGTTNLAKLFRWWWWWWLILTSQNTYKCLLHINKSVQSRQRMILSLGGGHKLFYKNPVYDVRRDVSYSPCCPELTKVW